jgi:hypothetical protein
VAVLVPFLLSRGNDQAPPAADPGPVVLTTPNLETAAPPPAGYRLYRDPAGWSIAVPTGWTTARDRNGTTFSDGDRVLQVSRQANPPEDPYAAQLSTAQGVGPRTAGYDFIRIARVSYRDWPTADWEYRSGTGPARHSLVRSTVPDSLQAYEIGWTTLDRRWAADKTYFDNAVRTFDPGA